MLRFVFCLSLLCVSLVNADEPTFIKEDVRWDQIVQEIKAEQQDGKWVIVATHVPSLRTGDQVVSLHGKTIPADADFSAELKKTIAAEGPQSIRIKVKRTETVNKRKKTEYVESFIPVRTLFDAAKTQFESTYDPINEWTVHSHKPLGDLTATTSLSPAIVQLKTGQTAVGLNVIYLGEQWLFIRELTVKRDTSRLDLTPTVTNQEVLPSAKILETATFVEAGIPEVRRVFQWFAADPPTTVYVRMSGLKRHIDHQLTPTEIVMFRNALLFEHFLKQQPKNR